jgi:hypothetical protein
MDPLSALSIAASVIQFLDFGSKIVSKGVHLYKSSDGTLSEHVEIEMAANRLREMSENFKKSARYRQQSPCSENRSELDTICDSCAIVSEELIAKLNELKVPYGHRHRKWKSFRQALKTVWSREEVDNIAKRLAGFRSELEIHLLDFLRCELNAFCFS